MIEPTVCVRCCARSGTYCDRCDLLVGLPGLHVIRVAEDGSDPGRGGRVATDACGLPAVWGDRDQSWPPVGVVGRCAVVRSSGADRVAEADLALQ